MRGRNRAAQVLKRCIGSPSTLTRSGDKAQQAAGPPSSDGEKSQSDVETSQQSDEGEIHSCTCPSREGQHQSQSQLFRFHLSRQEEKQAWQLQAEDVLPDDH